MKRGYFEIGIVNGKDKLNIGTLWRSAYQLGAAGIFTIGTRYTHQPSDTTKAYRHIPLRHYESFADFLTAKPEGVPIMGIEMGGTPLSTVAHPETAIYLLGAEDTGLPDWIQTYCNHIISLEAINQQSYNVAVAGTIVMYDRVFKK